MEKCSFTIRTAFIPPNGRLPRFSELPKEMQNQHSDKASADDIFFCQMAGHSQMPVKGFRITAYAYAKDGLPAKELEYGKTEEDCIEIECEDAGRYGTFRLRFRDIKPSFGHWEEQTGIEVLRDGIWKELCGDALLDDELYRLYVKLYCSSAAEKSPSKHSTLVRALMATCPSLRFGEAETLAVIALSHITNEVDENECFPAAYFSENAGGWAAFPEALASNLYAKEDWWTVKKSSVEDPACCRTLFSDSIPLGLIILSAQFCRGDQVEERGYIVFGTM